MGTGCFRTTNPLFCSSTIIIATNTDEQIIFSSDRNSFDYPWFLLLHFFYFDCLILSRKVSFCFFLYGIIQSYFRTDRLVYMACISIPVARFRDVDWRPGRAWFFLEICKDGRRQGRFSPCPSIPAHLGLFIAVIGRNLYVTPLTELSARGSTYFSFHAASTRADFG